MAYYVLFYINLILHFNTVCHQKNILKNQIEKSNITQIYINR